MPSTRGHGWLNGALQAAIGAGLLPRDANLPPIQDSRPWPVLLLTAVGAWLAAIPLLAVVGLLLGDVLKQGAGMYPVGVLLLAAAVVVLRARGVPLFVEQLAVPVLLVGGGTLAFGLFRDLDTQAAALVLCMIALGIATWIERPWLRLLLGAAASSLAAAALVPGNMLGAGQTPGFSLWLALHATMFAWLAALAAQVRLTDAQHAKAAASLEAIGAGWLLAAIVGLAWLAGMTFLVGGAMGSGLVGELASTMARGSRGAQLLQRAASALLAAAGCAVLARGWPTVRSALAACVALVLVALAGFMPSLGALLLVLACTAATQRWRLAAAAAVAAAWVIGAFYYRLQWSLTDKALLLVTSGAVLGAVAWLARRQRRTDDRATLVLSRARSRAPAFWLATSAIAVLAVVNYGIWQKEALIGGGERVFVELAPVDPRSLMAGDYMRLNYRLPGGVDEMPQVLTFERPYVVVRRDARGVARPLRIVHVRERLEADEHLIELTPKDGRWTLVSDAWHFPEGDAQRWAPARYGEFRVMPDGRALLVGLADKDLRSLR